MGGNRQKKSFGIFSIFKSTKTRRGRDVGGTDDCVKSYKVYPSDEDRGRWVAEPGIDKRASAYIAITQRNWNLVRSDSTYSLHIWLETMGGNRHKKSFGIFSIFKSTRTRRSKEVSGMDDCVKSYKVYPSDEDRGRWVAEPGIDKRASAYIAITQRNWNLVDVSY
ncbi:hypothetical protein POM88_024052 [Heracleum sosnowskyi]|uniref:Uncharacterized protein n=1 Tax=Heracleum sosnowskyi TaxID=360622 RepID=A0AAD8IIC5_9APIA|nr:hypothetical protein POM88_024052 [Heracleum sosnowskyi]